VAFLKKNLNIFFVSILVLNISSRTNAGNSATIDRYQKTGLIEPLTAMLIPQNKNSNAIELYNLGILNIKRNQAQAISYFKESGRQGLPEAQFNFARYDSKNSKEPNFQEAIKWYKLAAKTLFPPALFNLSIIFTRLTDLKDNHKTALKWCEKAAKIGYAPAQSNLGILYLRGESVEKSTKKGISLLTQAAAQDHLLSFYNLGVAYEDMAETKKSEVYRAYAIRWYERASLRGNRKAMLYLGSMLEDSAKTHEDLKKAHMWINISIAIKCAKDRSACKWNTEMFKGPANISAKQLWDLRIQIERKLPPNLIKEAHSLAADLVNKNKYIKEQISSK